MDGTCISRSEGQRIVKEASKWENTIYVYGGTTKNGADCSGSTWAIYRDAGFPYENKYKPSSQFGQNPRFKLISTSSPQEGDVAWWSGHVAIYAGDGTIWTAHRSGGHAYSRVPLPTWIKSRNGIQPKWYRYLRSE